MAKDKAKAKSASKPERASKKAGKAEKPSKPELSTERVTDSDVEMESSSEDTPEPAKKSTGTKSKAPVTNGRTESSDESSSDESDSPKANGAESSEESESDDSSSGSKAQSSDESESGSGSESESESEDESSSSEQEEEDGDETRPTAFNHTAQPYQPPNGFKPIDLKSAKISKAAKMLDKSNLAGKQLWHISMPKDIPASEIKELSLDKIAKGEAVISHKGADYGLMNDDQTQQNIALMLPGPSGFVRASTNFAKSFKLQQVVSLSTPNGTVTTGSSKSTTFAIPNKPARPQPKGLRMRYKPSGFGDDDPGTLGSSDSEEEPPSTTLASRPKQPLESDKDKKKEEKEKKKRKKAEGDGQEGEKRKKKKKKSEE